MNRRTHLRIDISALRHNLELLQKWNGPRFFCPMVKANAYGHGEIIVARAIEEMGIPTMGVALVEEGVTLREAGLQSKILTFAPLSPEGASLVIKHKLKPVIGRIDDLVALDKVRGNETVHAHLKFNTGMHRLGFDAKELPHLKSELQRRPWLKIHGVCTHLTHGEDAANPEGPTANQLQQFREMSKDFPGVRHAHKSASLATMPPRPDSDDIGARPGIGIYGLPHEGKQTGQGLRPVLTWMTEIVKVHGVEKGESVSYSARWRAERDSIIGVVPMGYGDGYMRALSNRSFMLCRGVRVPVVGSVCMDYTLVDLTEVSRQGAVQAGESIVVLGRQGNEEIPASELAELAGTIAYEVVTNISRRVARGAV